MSSITILKDAPKTYAWLVALIICLSSQPAHADMYQRCVALVAQDPDAAYDMALQWEATDLTGGAFHCGGLALAALRLFDAAAERFQRAALQDQGMSNAQHATLFRQSGEAWLLANRGPDAQEAFTKALEYSPQDPALLYGRARGYDLAGQTAEALADVTAAINLAPSQSLPYVLRARLNRLSGNIVDAERDVETAISMGVDMVTAQLERGLIRYEQNDDQGALDDWRSVIRADTAPDGKQGAAAIAATRFIAKIETPEAVTPPSAPAATQP